MAKIKITPSYKIFKIETHTEKYNKYEQTLPAGKSIIIDLERRKRLLGKSTYNYNEYNQYDDYHVHSVGKFKLVELPYKPCIIIRFDERRVYRNYDADINFSIYFGTRIGAFLYNTNLQAQTPDYTCGEWLLDFEHLKYPKTNQQLIKSSVEIINGFWQSSFDHFNYKNKEIKTIQRKPIPIKDIVEGNYSAKSRY